MCIETGAHEALQGGLENPDVLADEAPVLRGTALPHPSGKHPALNVVAKAPGHEVPPAPRLWDKDWYLSLIHISIKITYNTITQINPYRIFCFIWGRDFNMRAIAGLGHSVFKF